MAWTLTGRLIESCSCNMLCPCWFGVKELMVMDQGWCASAIVFPIQRGNSDGVDLGGRTVVLAADWPGPTLFDGNSTARLYIDDAANAEQRRELEAIFTGKKGGPMEVLAGLVTRWLPTRTASIDLKEDGRHSDRHGGRVRRGEVAEATGPGGKADDAARGRVRGRISDGGAGARAQRFAVVGRGDAAPVPDEVRRQGRLHLERVSAGSP
jgi:hypothetical protein